MMPGRAAGDDSVGGLIESGAVQRRVDAYLRELPLF
jgi:hypothetical protein